MNENILMEALASICDEEIAELDKMLSFKPSLHHRIAMKRIFRRFERNTRKKAPEFHGGNMNFKTRLIIIVAAIICAVLAVGFTVIYFSKAFHGTIYADNTRIYAVNTDNCPTTIEYTYYLPDLPKGFEMVEQDSTVIDVYTKYKNNLTGQNITLFQHTKNDFAGHFNTEHNDFEEIEINGNDGLYLPDSTGGLIIWDNGDYILNVSGNLTKNELLDLVKSAKVL